VLLLASLKINIIFKIFITKKRYLISSSFFEVIRLYYGVFYQVNFLLIVVTFLENYTYIYVKILYIHIKQYYGNRITPINLINPINQN
jgi:hypothetical protein